MINVSNKNIKYNKFMCDFYNEFKKINNNYSELVFLCIGTDRMTGDCFGPLVGNRIKEAIANNNINCIVYGDLENPLIYSDVDKSLKEIKKKCMNPCIIAIDAALSKESNIGKILVTKGGLRFGVAINKGRREVGNISIKAIIGKNYKTVNKNMQLLQNTSLNFVMSLVDIVSGGILEIIDREYNNFINSEIIMC